MRGTTVSPLTVLRIKQLTEGCVRGTVQSMIRTRQYYDKAHASVLIAAVVISAAALPVRAEDAEEKAAAKVEAPASTGLTLETFLDRLTMAESAEKPTPAIHSQAPLAPISLLPQPG